MHRWLHSTIFANYTPVFIPIVIQQEYSNKNKTTIGGPMNYWVTFQHINSKQMEHSKMLRNSTPQELRKAMQNNFRIAGGLGKVTPIQKVQVKKLADIVYVVPTETINHLMPPETVGKIEFAGRGGARRDRNISL